LFIKKMVAKSARKSQKDKMGASGNKRGMKLRER
jgi:hypothetical protein